MAVIVLCRIPDAHDDAVTRLCEAAGLALPYSGVELVFLGEDIDTPGQATGQTPAEEGGILLALRFPTPAAARTFRQAARQAMPAGESRQPVSFRLLALRTPAAGQGTALLFP